MGVGQLGEIQSLMGRYCRLVDQREWDAWSLCFTAEGAFSAGDTRAVGRRAIVEFVEGQLANLDTIRHLNHPASIELGEDGESAKAHSYFELKASTLRGRETEALGAYTDSLILSGEGWQFAERLAAFDFWVGRDEPWFGDGRK